MAPDASAPQIASPIPRQHSPRPMQEKRPRIPPSFIAAPARWWKNIAVPTLPVFACLLGGATEKWSEGIIVVLLGLALLADPPGFSLGRGFNLILLGAVAFAATAFLPANWFIQPAWRSALEDDFGIRLAGTLSPQPWISLGCFVSFLAGLSWLYYVSTLDLEVREVRQQLRRFVAGVVLLAALCITLHSAHTTLPFWHNQRGFGPFPNRNQTANLFGLTAVVILACGQDDIRHNRKRWIAWLLGLAIIIAAIVLDFSRAGVGAEMTADLRWAIFRDALQLIRASPWCGIGLGNFDAIFAMFRDASLIA